MFPNSLSAIHSSKLKLPVLGEYNVFAHAFLLKGVCRAQSILHKLHVCHLPLPVDFAPDRERTGAGLSKSIGPIGEASEDSNILPRTEESLNLKSLICPDCIHSGEGIDDSLRTGLLVGACVRQDFGERRVGVVEGDVGCVRRYDVVQDSGVPGIGQQLLHDLSWGRRHHERICLLILFREVASLKKEQCLTLNGGDGERSSGRGGLARFPSLPLRRCMMLLAGGVHGTPER